VELVFSDKCRLILVCNFRHLMERNNLGDELFRLVNSSVMVNLLRSFTELPPVIPCRQ
jgi:hypothetical protein